MNFFTALVIPLVLQPQIVASQREMMDATVERMIRWQVIEETERERFFNDFSLWQYYTDCMQQRLLRMNVDTPPVADKTRLPPLDDVWSWMQYNRKFIKYLRWVYPYLGPIEKRQTNLVIAESEYRLEVFDAMYDALQNTGPHGRRLSLQRLRELVGVDNYDNCRWPSPLPPAAYPMGWLEKETINYDD